ncbi:hypothetical protein [Pseudolabrys sp. FHR47]|uniref:hypothetical protein n=1 Tax=Pseudolabrys sp. FHR47 TaxID=2562284 RepID=UPI0010BE4E76|nr:hypothetical protein [Pseudolabrys sp. FHR47]
MIGILVDAIAAEIGRVLRRLTLRALLTLVAFALLLAAFVSALALLFVYLQATFGTMSTLAAIAGGNVLVAAILLAIAFSGTRRRAPPPQKAASTEADEVRATIAATERAVNEAADALREGSHERMVQAVTTAIVTGIVLGRRL